MSAPAIAVAADGVPPPRRRSPPRNAAQHLPPIPDMPAPAANGTTHAATAASNDAAAAVAPPASPPLHLIPPSDIAYMLDSQSRALHSLRTSNAALLAFQDYSARSLDSISSLHASRVASIRTLRDSLMDIFVRVRHLRMQLAERRTARALALGELDSLPPQRRGEAEEEAAEHEEIEQLKRELALEAEQLEAARRRAAQTQEEIEEQTAAMAGAAASAAMNASMLNSSMLSMASLPVSPHPSAASAVTAHNTSSAIAITPAGSIGGASAFASPAAQSVPPSAAATPHPAGDGSTHPAPLFVTPQHAQNAGAARQFASPAPSLTSPP